MHVCTCHDISVNASLLLIAPGPISFDEPIQNFAVKHPDRFDGSPFLQVRAPYIVRCGIVFNDSAGLISRFDAGLYVHRSCLR